MSIKESGDLGIQNDIVAEFGGTAPHQMTEYYRGGALVDNVTNNAAISTSGEISIGDFYGAGNVVAINLTIASNTNNYNVYTAASSNPAYVAGASQINVTVNPGVTVGSTSTGTYAMQVPSAFNPADQVNITNNGVIVGKGGNGGKGGGNNPFPAAGAVGAAAGHGLYINRPVTITNNGTLAGGGGGGGGSGYGALQEGLTPKSGPSFVGCGGQGGGGGAGVTTSSGGARGGTFERPGNAGAGGTATTGGAGGARNTATPNQTATPTSYTGKGGNGGARGSNGVASEAIFGIYDASNSQVPGSKAGGTRGRYITGNSFATWATNGTRLGASS